MLLYTHLPIHAPTPTHTTYTLPIYTFQQTTALDTHTHTPQDHNRHTYSISSEPSSSPPPVPDNAANQRCLLLKPHPYTQIHFHINEWVLHHLYDARWSTKIDSCFVLPMKMSRLARFVVGAFSHGDRRDDRIDVVVVFFSRIPSDQQRAAPMPPPCLVVPTRIW